MNKVTQSIIKNKVLNDKPLYLHCIYFPVDDAHLADIGDVSYVVDIEILSTNPNKFSLEQIKSIFWDNHVYNRHTENIIICSTVGIGNDYDDIDIYFDSKLVLQPVEDLPDKLYVQTLIVAGEDNISRINSVELTQSLLDYQHDYKILRL